MKRETLPGGTVLYTTPAAAITTDSLLLIEFCRVKPGWNVCDLCCGGGILLFSLLDKGLRGHAVGVELDPQRAELAQKSAQENGLDNVEFLCEDIRTYRQHHGFDLVVANPPYFSAGKPAATPQRAMARHQMECTIEDVCAAAFGNLKDGGRFCLCWPAGQAAALFSALQTGRLAPTRMQLVRKRQDANARLILLESRRTSSNNLQIMPDIILSPDDNTHY